MKKVFSVILFFVFLASFLIFPVYGIEIKENKAEINAKSAILMDVNTKTVLYEKNSEQALPPASVTKVMTLLLVFEALENGKLNYEDILTVSENASSMGGSQVYLEPGEKMSVEELLKCVIISSANDAAVTLAEHVGGSEEAFIEMMNNKAKELGMENTHFENATGLDDDVQNHLTSAKDIAIMSCELLKYEKVSTYATTWMDTIRNGEFGLTNTNRLVRYYNGVTGLKTGYTASAGYCLSASAKRNGLHLVAVVMGAESSTERTNIATKLLDFGFANYSLYSNETVNEQNISVYGGKKDSITLKFNEFNTLVNKGSEQKIEKEIILDDHLCAPIKTNEIVGKVIYKLNGETIGESDIIACEGVEKISLIGYTLRILKNLF